MLTHEDESVIALQPETQLEQSLMGELFVRLNHLADAPEHPEKVGSVRVFYDTQLDQFDDLDLKLWRAAEIGVDANGRLDPEAGSRALVVVHTLPEEVDESEPVEVPTAGPTKQAALDGFTPDEIEAAEALGEFDDLSVEATEYADLQSVARPVESIAANQSHETLVEELSVLRHRYTTAVEDAADEPEAAA